MAITFFPSDLGYTPPHRDLTCDTGKEAFANFVREKVRAGLSDEQIFDAGDDEGFRGSLPAKAIREGIVYIAKFERANIEAERAAKEEGRRKFTEAAADHLKLLELLQERLPSMIESIKAAQTILAVEPEA